MSDEHSRIVASSIINGVLVSTAFLPICLTFEDGEPQAFETVVIRGHKALALERYADLAEALKGHDAAIENLPVK